MGWQDRPYYRDRSTSPRNPLMWLLTGSVPLFTAFEIRVRAHASLLLFIFLTLILSETSYGIGPHNAVTSTIILFGSVLLHEFGHCFGARWVGGDANDILLWPLGGLAAANPPHRPWASFFTTACGPLVNLAICLITGAALSLAQHTAAVLPWLPRRNLLDFIPVHSFSYYLWWIFAVNYGLLLFNLLLVFYPFDGGRMIQELLWVKIGHYRSMWIATITGMIGAAVIGAVGLASWSTWWGLNLVILAIFGFLACRQQRQILRETGPEEDWSAGTDYSAAYETHYSSKPRRRKISRRAINAARRRAEQAAQEQAQVDAILAKVSAHGMGSVTWRERRILRKATEHQRQRDLENLKFK